MLSFLLTFSESFKLALIFWLPAACLAILPIYLWFYYKKRRVENIYMGAMFLVILYLLGLLAFTLYPLPDDPVAYCSQFATHPQLVPFHWVSDVVHYGKTAVLQIVMNIIFFVPIGIFARAIFGLTLRRTALLAFIASGLVELLQLTGVAGVYPCSYRLFDVDDLMVNTLGGMVGYAIGRLLPRLPLWRPEHRSATDIPDIDRYTVSVYCDAIVAQLLTMIVLLPTLGGDLTTQSATTITLTVKVLAAALVGLLIPYWRNGQSIGGIVTQSKLQSSRASQKIFTHASLFYTVYILVILVSGVQAVLVTFVLYAWYAITKKLPYQR